VKYDLRRTVVFRPEVRSILDQLTSPDDFPLVISARRYTPGYSHSPLSAPISRRD